MVVIFHHIPYSQENMNVEKNVMGLTEEDVVMMIGGLYNCVVTCSRPD